jgi:hypothetical protein
MKERIVVDERALRKRYAIRRISPTSLSWETTIPREVVEREARLLGIPLEKVETRLEVEWRFNDFKGLHMVLVPKGRRVTRG